VDERNSNRNFIDKERKKCTNGRKSRLEAVFKKQLKIMQK